MPENQYFGGAMAATGAACGKEAFGVGAIATAAQQDTQGAQWELPEC